MANIPIIINNKETIDALNRLKLSLEVNPLFMNILGSYQIAMIKLRTAESKDFEGIPFKPYSEAYKKYKRKKKKPVNKPNLIFSGRMLASMNAQVMRGPKVRIGFPGTQVDKAIWNNATREFFRPSYKDIEKIKEMVDAEVARIIKKSEKA